MSIVVKKSIDLSDITIIGAQYSIDDNKNIVFIIPANSTATVSIKFTLDREGVAATQSTRLSSINYYYIVGDVDLLPFSIAPTMIQLIHDPITLVQTPILLATDVTVVGTGLTALTATRLGMKAPIAFPTVLGDVADGVDYLATLIYHANTVDTTVTLYNVLVTYVLDRT